MRKAIAIPYSVEQNEPSRPLAMLVDIPDDVEQRNQLLKKLFSAHVMEVVDDDELTVEDGQKNDYGDLIVSYCEDFFLYITFVETVATSQEMVDKIMAHAEGAGTDELLGGLQEAICLLSTDEQLQQVLNYMENHGNEDEEDE